tara:strand:+ start:145 stop:522 length:378 start_codon:yes stop_codon:yes gene_type:complete
MFPRPFGVCGDKVQAASDIIASPREPVFLANAVAFHPLALQLAGAANGSGLFAGALLARLFEVTTQLHFAINALTLQLLLESPESLVDIVIANDDLHKTLLPRFLSWHLPAANRPRVPIELIKIL